MAAVATAMLQPDRHCGTLQGAFVHDLTACAFYLRQVCVFVGSTTTTSRAWRGVCVCVHVVGWDV